MQTGIKWRTISATAVAILLSLRANPVQAFGLLIFAALLQHYRQTALPLKEDPLTGNQPALSEYDFIIVGAGSSGTLLANRLTENPNWKVLLIEAGGEDTVVTDVPLIAYYFQQTDYNWGYKMEWQPNVCLGMVDQRCPWPRGKVLGGTSTINYMIYTRGNPKDYDEWEAQGNTGWGYKSVLPYFLKTERCNIPEYNNSKYHNSDGLLPVERVPAQTPLLNIFLDAGKELGYKIIDYNNPKTHIGFSALQANMHRGHRAGGSNTFLRTIRNRPNLHILAEARATRVLFDQSTMRATAVELVRQRKWRVIRARKEVILSAGAINSPHILMHSGIGPADHLSEKGIRVLKNLKVGYNLYEHLATAGLTFLVNQSIGLTQDVMDDPNTLFQWLKGTGFATIPGGVEGLAYINTKYNTDRNRPDIEFIFASGSLNTDTGVLRGGMGISDETYNAMWGTIPLRHAWTVWPMILNPKSRGRIMLRDNNPFHWPLMIGNYFQDETDLKVIIEGIKAVIRMSETKAFQQVGSTLHRAPPPNCAHLEFATDPYWECLIRTITSTLHHQCGTCKMGPATDPDAVVDPQLRVYGTTGLRVVDASILPKVPAAHINAASYMVAEKAADFIKDTWKSDLPPPTPNPTGTPPYLTLPTPTGTPPPPTQRPPAGYPQGPSGIPSGETQPVPAQKPSIPVPGSSGYPNQPQQGSGNPPKHPQQPSYPQPPQQPSYPQPPQQPSNPQPPQQPSNPQPPQQPSYPQPPQQPSNPQPPQQPSYPQQPSNPQPPQQPSYPQPPQQPSYPQQPSNPQPPQQPSYPQQPSNPQPPQQPSYPQPPQQPSYPQPPQQPSYPQPPQRPLYPQPGSAEGLCPYPLVPVKHPSIPVGNSVKYLCQDPSTIPPQYPKLFLQPSAYYSNEVRSFSS